MAEREKIRDEAVERVSGGVEVDELSSGTHYRIKKSESEDFLNTQTVETLLKELEKKDFVAITATS